MRRVETDCKVIVHGGFAGDGGKLSVGAKDHNNSQLCSELHGYCVYSLTDRIDCQTANRALRIPGEVAP